jgi:hypothetical protein
MKKTLILEGGSYFAALGEGWETTPLRPVITSSPATAKNSSTSVITSAARDLLFVSGTSTRGGPQIACVWQLREKKNISKDRVDDAADAGEPTFAKCGPPARTGKGETMALIRVLLIAFLTVGAADAKELSLCQTDLSLSQSQLANQLAFGQLSFTSTTERSTLATLVTLTTTKPVNRLFALVEFLDEDAKLVMSIPLVAETRSELMSEVPGKLDLFIRTRKELESPAAPGEPLNLVGVSEYVLLVCPARARVAMLDLHYADGTRFQHSESVWTIQSDVRQVQHLDFPHMPPQSSQQYLASVSLDRNGRITAIQTLSHAKSIDVDFLKNQLSNWRFNAKVENGDSVASEVTLLFRFHSAEIGEPSPAEEVPTMSGPVRSFIPIDVFQPQGTDKQIITVGGIPY